MLNGAVLLDKPPGTTSFGALGPLKRAFDTRRIGHTGTLDPFASGLLIALVGKMTRLAGYVTDYGKEYLATFRFGEETDTLDTEGKVLYRAPVPTETAIRSALPAFLGSIDQRPPAFSAVHVDGVRAHRLARGGQSVDISLRRVVIHAFEPLEWDPPDLRVRIDCGKGTYVRSLARDLGLAVDSRAYVSELRRTRVGPYSVDAAVAPETAAEGGGLLTPREFLALGGQIPEVPVTDEAVGRIRNGTPLSPGFIGRTPPREGLFSLVHEGSILALCRSQGGELSYLAVL
jgi:tRNA pseudouridine55 synthase